jgi:preprotein translocase subunit SecA
MVDAEKTIQLIDQFTARILKGREYSDGLHQAIQPKKALRSNKTTVTFGHDYVSNFFRLYKKFPA